MHILILSVFFNFCTEVKTTGKIKAENVNVKLWLKCSFHQFLISPDKFFYQGSECRGIQKLLCNFIVLFCLFFIVVFVCFFVLWKIKITKEVNIVTLKYFQFHLDKILCVLCHMISSQWNWLMSTLLSWITDILTWPSTL